MANERVVDQLIAKVREAVGEPGLEVVVSVDDREDKTIIRAGGRDFKFSNIDIGSIQLWSVAFSRMANKVAQGLKEGGNA